MAQNIVVNKVEKSKIDQVDFNNLAFGSIFSDHMLVCNFKDGKWQSPTVEPYAPIQLDPASKIFHYGQSIFEGMKAYKDVNDSILLFRPLDNWSRLNKSAERLVIPGIPEDIFMEGLTKLLKIDSDWIPTVNGSSL